MSKYQSFYFLHIPKTGGRFIREHVLDPVCEILKKNNVKILEIPKGVDRHGGWHKDIDDNSYIFSIFRDPVECVTSFYAHLIGMEVGYSTGIQIGDNSPDTNFLHLMEMGTENTKNILKNTKLSKDEFLYWITYSHYIYNYQSKNIILTCKENEQMMDVSQKYTMDLHDNNKKLDKDLLWERLKRINLFLRQDMLLKMDYQILADKILSDFGIEEKFTVSKDIDMEYYVNYASSNLHKRIKEEDLEVMSKYLKYDTEIYNTKELFWSTE